MRAQRLSAPGCDPTRSPGPGILLQTHWSLNYPTCALANTHRAASASEGALSPSAQMPLTHFGRFHALMLGHVFADPIWAYRAEHLIRRGQRPFPSTSWLLPRPSRLAGILSTPAVKKQLCPEHSPPLFLQGNPQVTCSQD